MQSKVESSLAGFNAASSISGSGTSGQIAFFNGANSITSSASLLWDGTNVRVNGGIGINTAASTTNIANFVLNQNASTRMVLSNSTAGGSNDVRFVMSSATDSLVFIADTAGTILSGASLSELGINQSGAKPIVLRTNSTVRLTISSAGVLTIGSGGTLLLGNYHIEPGETNIGNSSTSFAVDWSANSAQRVTLTGNVTAITMSNPQTGGTYVLRVLTGAGSFTATGWPVAVLWAAGTAPTITATASKVDIITLYYDGTNYFGSFTQNY